MSLIKAFIIVAMVLLGLNLLLTVGNLEGSPLLSMSGKIITDDTDTWALRGQIGDILSGHFSALAFLAVALSIILQNEANKQMRESINKQEEALKQQSKALKVQSKSLKAQIKELQASREESSKQTEEFFIQNINLKLDRYYNQIHNLCEKCYNIEKIPKNADISKYNNPEGLKQMRDQASAFVKLLSTTRTVYNIIKSLETSSPDIYNVLYSELLDYIGSEIVFLDMYQEKSVDLKKHPYVKEALDKLGVKQSEE